MPEDQIEDLASNSANTVPVMMPYIDGFAPPELGILDKHTRRNLQAHRYNGKKRKGPTPMNTRKLTRTALFAALTAAGAFIRIPLGYSSITLQFLCTAMAGCLLGPAYGAASQAVYVALGLIGLPIFTQGGGLSYLMQPTCGFLIGLIPTAWLIGLLTAKRELRPLRTAAACLAGLAMLYAVGLPYMAVILNGYMGKGMDVSAILWAGMLPFLPGDMLKIAVTALLAPLLQKRLSAVS